MTYLLFSFFVFLSSANADSRCCLKRIVCNSERCLGEPKYQVRMLQAGESCDKNWIYFNDASTTLTETCHGWAAKKQQKLDIELNSWQ